MSSVYVNNLIINSGSDFSQSFTINGVEDNSSYDLTGFTVTAQMRKYSGSSSYTSFVTTIVNPPTLGKIILSLPASTTVSLKPGRYVYDVIIEKNSYKTRVLEGMVLVREGVTR